MLAEAEKIDIRIALGWSERFHEVDTRLERAMSALESAGADAEAKVRDLVSEIARLDTAIVAAEGRLKAAKVGSIELNAREIRELQRLRRMHCGRLASYLGVPVRHDSSGAILNTGLRAYPLLQG